jgi:hypothetical protein
MVGRWFMTCVLPVIDPTQLAPLALLTPLIAAAICRTTNWSEPYRSSLAPTAT